jgi:hypothetical protein
MQQQPYIATVITALPRNVPNFQELIAAIMPAAGKSSEMEQFIFADICPGVFIMVSQS